MSVGAGAQQRPVDSSIAVVILTYAPRTQRIYLVTEEFRFESVAALNDCRFQCMCRLPLSAVCDEYNLGPKVFLVDLTLTVMHRIVLQADRRGIPVDVYQGKWPRTMAAAG